jgi:hypothetical protein
MLPTDWKKEIESAVDEAQKRSDENRERAEYEQQATIAAPLNSLRNHLKAYIKKQDRYEKGKRCREMATIIGLGFTAVFTLGLATVGIAQVYTFIVSERAFIVPIETNFTNGLVVNENPLEMWIALKNKGKSIGSIDVLEVAITHKLSAEPTYLGAQKIAYPPIGPGERFERPMEFVTGWPQQTIDKLTHRVLDLFLFGRVRYRDDFSWFGPRVNGFCFKYVFMPSAEGGPHFFEPCRQTAYTYSQ